MLDSAHSLAHSLECILDHFRRLGRKVLLARLSPGHSLSHTDGRLAELGLAGSGELTKLYAWRDGTAVSPGVPIDDVHFLPGYYFLSLEDAIANWLAFRDDDRWNPAWLPIFASGGGDFYAVDCSAGDQAVSPVVGFLLDEPEHPVEYESVTAMMATIADCFREGAFFVDRDGCLDMEDEEHAQIAAKHNPGLSIWH